jgi:ribulose-5-phosphate 4-epimerase/fuculose-1-phosphate aldolase
MRLSVLGHVKILCLLAAAAVLINPGRASTQVRALDRRALVDDIVTANRILANEGVLDGYGHVSVRNPANATRYLLAAAKAPALVTAADIIEYGLDSTPVAATAATGYTERFIHGEIYRARPDVMAVVHCHCPEVIPFAATRVPMRPMYHMAFFVGEGVSVFEIRKAGGVSDMLVRTPELGRLLARTLGAGSAALMRGHGAVVAAPSLHQVVGRAYYLNLNARLQLQAMQLAGRQPIAYLDAQEAKSAEQDYERSWEFWKSRLPRLDGR